MSDLSLPDPTRYPHSLDIQHDTDPEQNHGIAKRIPHMGHAALFLGITILSFLICLVIVGVTFFLTHPKVTPADTMAHYAYLNTLIFLLSYVLTLGISYFVFPLIWGYSFFGGIHWTARPAARRWWMLMLVAVVLNVFAVVAEHFIKAPKEIDILKLFNSPASAWLTTVFGATLAPVFEEIVFRGFLLPAFATTYDWLALERTPAALNRWQLTTDYTNAALVLASLVTSALFAALHGLQIHWSFGTLGILFVVSLTLCAVRIRYRSVAASSLVHGTYNSLIFIAMLIQTGGFRHLERLAH